MSSLLFASKFLSKFTTGLFAGSALYCSLAEHPGRMACETRVAASVFPPAFKLAATWQVGLILTNSAAALYAFSREKDNRWLAVALLSLAILPYTYVTLMPINYKLLDPNLDKDSPNTKSLLQKWGQFHWVRSLVGIVVLTLVNLA